MLKSQKGFAAVEAVIIVILLAAAGFAGYRVWQKHTQQTPATKQTTAHKTTTAKPADTIPDGFVAYKAKDLDISFAYPKAWGDLTFRIIRAYATNGAESGPPLKGVVGGYIGDFSKVTRVYLKAISKSNVHEPAGRVDTYLGSGFCVKGDKLLLEDANLVDLPMVNGIGDVKNEGARCSKQVDIVKTVKKDTSYVVKLDYTGGTGTCTSDQKALGCGVWLMAISKIKPIGSDISAVVLVSSDTTQSESDTLAQILKSIKQL